VLIIVLVTTSCGGGKTDGGNDSPSPGASTQAFSWSCLQGKAAHAQDYSVSDDGTVVVQTDLEPRAYDESAYVALMAQDCGALAVEVDDMNGSDMAG
jgi:hypothetical protein